MITTTTNADADADEFGPEEDWPTFEADAEPDLDWAEVSAALKRHTEESIEVQAAAHKKAFLEVEARPQIEREAETALPTARGAGDRQATPEGRGRASQPIPRPIPLADLLAEPDDPTVYRAEGLWPSGGRVVLAAPMKSGKTTLTGNLLRSLVDGQSFLGHFEVQQAQRVVLLDAEMDPRQIKRWLRSQGIRYTERIEVVSLRGQVATFDLLDASRRAEWVEVLYGAEVVVLDCLRPVLDALGLSEDKEAGRFLVAFDALLSEATVGEALVVHHTGHAGERSRGDSCLRDWPDAEWRISRDTDDDSKPRFFRAFGRDVDVAEGRLAFDAASRHLTYVEGEDRRSAVDEKLIKVVLEFVRDHPGANSSTIIDELECGKPAATQCLHRCERDFLLVEDGAKRAKLHTLSSAGETWLQQHAPNGKLVTSA